MASSPCYKTTVLQTLSIRNLAIIEDSSLQLSKGLNVLTGETGAGKSIIVAALSLILGDRADSGLIRRGEKQAELEAVFDISGLDQIRQKMDELLLLDPDDQDLLIVRRVLSATKSRVFINQRAVTLSTLSHLMRGLVDISSQHQHTHLLDPKTHLEILDRFGGIWETRVLYEVAFDAFDRSRKELRALEKKEQLRREREEFVRFSIGEIEELDPKENELEDLSLEREKLLHADKLRQGTMALSMGLDGGAQSVMGMLRNLFRDLDKIVDFDGQVGALAERLESSMIELSDIAAEASAYAHDVDADPLRLDAILGRLDGLKKLERKYQGDLSHVLEIKAQLSEELAAFESLDWERKQLEKALQEKKDVLEKAGKALSQARKKASLQLSKRLKTELESLAMQDASIEFVLTPLDAPLREGFESGEIHIETNLGEGMKPLHRSASGGELARVLLAFKRVLMHVDGISTCVFDEVDTGTGGAVGDMIGQKLSDIAAERQVLCITHLPQIAARGERHLFVHKHAVDGRTVTGVRVLSEEEREEEIARMLGGIEVTESAKHHAQELMSRSS